LGASGRSVGDRPRLRRRIWYQLVDGRFGESTVGCVTVEIDSDASRLPLFGERLCLDFANTFVWRSRARPEDALATYGDLLAWSHQAGSLDADEVDRLFRAAADRPEEAAGVLSRAIALRGAVRRLVEAIIHSAPVAASDLTILNAILGEAMARATIGATPAGFAWDWPPATADLARPLWPVARSAAELLTTADLSRLRRCPGCGGLFLDVSKNRSRRWCRMAVCGNRARARRHYQRRRGADQAAAPGREFPGVAVSRVGNGGEIE
jgi:predicted RNA-binding Zn ribbon-like protein